MHRILGLVLTVLLWGGNAAAQDLTGVQVHLTIDDVPWQQAHDLPLTRTVSSLHEYNNRLIDTLRKQRVSASVFVVCSRLRENDGLISIWQNAGHVVGNHTNAHAGASRIDQAAWLDGVSVCQHTLARRLGKPPKWFRFPYLDHGPDASSQAAIRKGLKERDLTNSPVTAATSEWLVAQHYRRAFEENNTQRQAFLVTEYISHMLKALEESHRLALEIAGRAVPQTLLIHLNELNADHLDTLLTALKDAGATFVPLDTAMADEVYTRPSLYTGRGGTSWFHRIRPTKTSWFGIEQKRLSDLLGSLK